MPISPIDELRLKFAVVRIARQQLYVEYHRTYQIDRAKEMAAIRLIESQPLQRIRRETHFKNDTLQRMGCPKFIRAVNGILAGEFTQCGNRGSI